MNIFDLELDSTPDRETTDFIVPPKNIRACDIYFKERQSYQLFINNSYR